MRSVFVYLRGTTEAEVAAHLDRAYPGQREPWLVTSGGEPCLYINFHRDARCEFEPGDWEELMRRFGGEPAVGVVADVSGRHPGDRQALDFASDLLGQFCGAAKDDYTPHLWSLDELLARHHVSGHPFFDHNGWNLADDADG